MHFQYRTMKNQLSLLIFTCLFLNTISAQVDSTRIETLKVDNSDTINKIPEEPGEAIPKLYGFWRVICIDDGKKKIKQPKQIAQSGIGFSKLNEHKTGVGRIYFNEGCKSIRGLWFKHHGNGEIEMPTGITESYDVGCPEYNHEIRKLIPKLIDRFHVSFIQDDKIILKNDSIEVRLKRVR